MKNLVLTAAALFGLAAASMGQTLPAYLPTDGLVGWWPFNGNANDESGNGNNGTVNGATLIEDRFGVANCAYDFDGVNDLITIPNSSTINITGSSLSISMWINYDILNNSTIHGISKGGYDIGSGYELVLDYRPITAAPYIAFNGGGGTAAGAYFNSYQNIWTHAIATFNNGIGQIYINGEPSSFGAGGAPFLNFISNLNDLTIGSRTLGNNYLGYTKGSIDDIAIYNRALTQEEITALYTGVPVNPPTACNPLPANLQYGLVGYWPFCGNANDESGNGNDGAVNGATLTTDRFGDINNAYSFANDNNITTPFTPSNVVNTTYSAWFKTINGGAIVGSNASISEPNLVLAIHTNSTSTGNQGTALWVVDHEGSSVGWMSQPPTNALYNDNEWHHMVGIFDCPGGNVIQPNNFSLFVDGQLITTISQNVNPPTSPINIMSNIVFGYNQRWLSQGFDGRFIGSLDDIGIWNRALSADEVQQLYTLNACTFTVYDTVTVTQTVYDTITTYTSVTDTLIINTLITELAPPANSNTIKVFPNPANSHITIDYGNFALMNGYQLRIENSLGQQVFQTNISQQSDYLSLNTWGGNGLYFVHIIDPQGNTIYIRKIVLQ